MVAQLSERTAQTADFLEKMRQQFDNAPYPRVPLDQFPDDPVRLHIHSLVTAYYRRHQQIISTEGKLILDAGCGTGYKSLELAIANPGAKIFGIDLSDESVKLARQRLHYHNVKDAEFFTMTVEDLPSLGMQFDYINTDDVLYLLPDPVEGLKALRSVLKPQGILRANFHSSLQRALYLRSQQFFKMVGAMQNGAEQTDIELVRMTMRCLKDGVRIKSATWNPTFETDDERVLANHLLQGDKGWTILEFFAALRAADLEFISMVDWRSWDLLDLFRDLDDLPASVLMEIADKSVEEQLHLFELLQPIHRLLDIWCGLPGETPMPIPVSEWEGEDWQNAKVHLQPQLNTPGFREDLTSCICELKMFEISKHLRLTEPVATIDSLIATCLLPLLEGTQTMMTLVHRWLKVRPIHPVTLAPTSEAEAFELVRMLLLNLEEMGYILLER